MRHLIAAVLLSFPILASGQPATDFMVTDSDGNVHNLYADYLDQDKTVLIKIFFTTCPPCRSIASSVEIFYQQWGAGAYDVEFIELSDKSFDDDQRVNDYKAEFGITFPSVGADGGSLEAVVPYKDGTYGPWLGTPTFVVIGPDGEVQYDVDGPDLWQALDDALYATGALKPGDDPDSTDNPIPEPIVVEGKVTYYASSEGIGNAHVIVKDDVGNDVSRDTTDADGTYSLALDSAQVADEVLTIEVEKVANPKNGVSPIDLLNIQKHLLGIEYLQDPQEFLASDANQSSSVSALDLLTLIKLLLDETDHFPDGLSWDFYPADFTFSAPIDWDDPEAIFNLTDQLGWPTVSNILEGSASPDFRGIKRGDVNQSANLNE